jgi:hypothetical protein
MPWTLQSILRIPIRWATALHYSGTCFKLHTRVDDWMVGIERSPGPGDLGNKLGLRYVLLWVLP